MEEISSFDTPKIVFGFDSINELWEICEDSDVYIITDPGVVEAGISEKIEAPIQEFNGHVEVFDEVQPEPLIKTCEKAVENAHGKEFDVVIGLGGGSSLDVAKVTSTAMKSEIDLRKAINERDFQGEGTDLVLIPTTAGTGSEVTDVAVLADDEEGHIKKAVYHESLMADYAIVDPELTFTLPQQLTATTGIDALVHAIEAYTTKSSNLMTDTLAEKAIDLISSNLKTAYYDGQDRTSRYNMSLAATMAGLAFINSGLGAVHALSYPIGIEFGMGHGEANALVLPHVVEYNVPSEIDKYAKIAQLMGVESGDLSRKELAYKSVEEIKELEKDLNIYRDLRDVGVSKEDFDDFADIALEYSNHNIEANPRTLSKEDLIKIYELGY